MNEIWSGGGGGGIEVASLDEGQSLLSSKARIQVPWVKVTIGDYTFGIYSKTGTGGTASAKASYKVKYPNFVQSLQVQKINGQVNQYSLNISYPVTQFDDPNFFEKVFSSVSGTRKIIFSYGDAALPEYTYKDEEAIITDVSQGFNFGNGGTIDAVITYQVKAVSSVGLVQLGNYTFVNNSEKKPSDELKKLLQNDTYGLKGLLTGVTAANIDKLIDGSDKAVKLETKTNVSSLEYANYLTSCMVPADSPQQATGSDIYALTIHDETTKDKLYSNANMLDGSEITGPYMKVERVTTKQNRSDAYTIDVGINTSTIVTSLSIKNNESYSIYFDYQNSLNDNQYISRLNTNGIWEDTFAPSATSKNDLHVTKPDDTTWWTKLTKYPISADITIQGLLRPAILMQYIRLNVIFPGGQLHTSSGLYIVTKQVDTINMQGYRTQLSLTRIDT